MTERLPLDCTQVAHSLYKDCELLLQTERRQWNAKTFDYLHIEAIHNGALRRHALLALDERMKQKRAMQVDR